MMVDTGIGVDRLAYHVYQDVFNDFFPDKQRAQRPDAHLQKLSA